MTLLISFLSFLGLLISYHIYKHKKDKKILICPLKADCEGVIHSKYSKFLGIELEKLGIFYYIIIFISYSINKIFNLQNLTFDFILLSLSLLAFLFSIYLTLIQILKLRKLCSWCLASFVISTLIFFSSYFLLKESLILIAQSLKTLTIFIHALSASVGLGLILVIDYLFFKFLKDKKIDEREKEILDDLSDFVWLILGLIIVSGFFLYISNIEEYQNSVKFQFKIIVVLVLVINGFLMNFFVSPKLIELDFKNLSSYKEKMLIIMGTISIISWFSAFILGRLKQIDVPLINLLTIYLLLILISSVFSFYFFRLKSKNR